jgi:hypothetical protein
MGEGQAGTKGEGLILDLMNQLSAAGIGNALFRPPGTPTVRPAGLEAPRAFLTTATVQLVSQLSSKWRMIRPP